MPLVEFFIACCLYAPYVILVSYISIGTVVMSFVGYDYFFTPTTFVDVGNNTDKSLIYLLEVTLTWTALMMLMILCSLYANFIVRYCFNPQLRQKFLYHSEDFFFHGVAVILYNIPIGPDFFYSDAVPCLKVFVMVQSVFVACQFDWLRVFGIRWEQMFYVQRHRLLTLAVSCVVMHLSLCKDVGGCMNFTLISATGLALIQVVSFCFLPGHHVVVILWWMSRLLRILVIVEITLWSWLLLTVSWASLSTAETIAMVCAVGSMLAMSMYDLWRGTKFLLHGLVPGCHPLAA